MKRILVSTTVVLALLLAACGGDDDGGEGENGGSDGAETSEATREDGGEDEETDGGGSDFHACDLFTGAELGELIGAEVSDGRDYLATNADATNCTWEGDAAVFIEVLLDGGPDWFDAIHVGGDPGDLEEVDGLGDRAVWDNFLNSLDVVDGDRFIAIQTLTSFTDLDAKETAILVAEEALGRLP